MKTRCVLMTVSLIPVLSAGEPDGGGPDIHVPLLAQLSGWEIGIGAAPIFGADVSFSGLGQWRSPNFAAPAAGTFDRYYDDGFNRVDATGNAGGLTSYWGYMSSRQYNPAGTGSISMSTFNSRQTGSAGEDDIGWGGEIFAYKALGTLTSPFGGEAKWGIRLGCHLNEFSFDNRANLATTTGVVTDSFDLGGTAPPAAPFSGSPAGFGNALLSDQPSRTFSTQMAGVTGSRELDVTLFGLSFGPYIEFPITRDFAIRAEGGISLAVAHGEYSHTSVTTVPGIGSQTWQASSNDTSLLPGFYLGAYAAYSVNERLKAYAGLRYQFYDSLDVSAGGSNAKLDFDEAVMVTVGLSRAF
jgi:hypothetical protein